MRSSIQSSIAVEGQPMDRAPNLIGFGKVPSLMPRYILLRERPVRFITSGSLSICSVIRTSRSNKSDPYLLVDWSKCLTSSRCSGKDKPLTIDFEG